MPGSTSCRRAHHCVPSTTNHPLLSLERLRMHTATLFAPGLYSSGQPSVDDLAALAAIGVRSIINLRGADEDSGYDEAHEAARLGMRYMTLPIVGPDAVTAENAARLAHAIQHARTDGDVLVHCASGNRVGALIALERGRHGDSPAQAIALGRAAGLTTLEPCVVQLLNP
ncbi:beta-lactamase hydrolase domain-containing protein [Xanthomonas campestris]|uniref:beta-lactamase hydrolase domain-containing protein n=1 Tax=Xanthomonas campestris TaxID=339 RepID=UPI0012903A2F|nr:protein tyrosine phosphatase family protein [Xanthomonas campestris]MEA9725758.1 protein tyrosine phosphatase family protein [Xanthomonas campestris pv. raphani]MEB2184641.1 protein tyrosine phosphatase family protein [Xanthomonas campestris pv. campestris]